MGLKVWAYIALAVILISALGTGLRAVYLAGYNKATVAQQALAIKAQNDALAKAKAEWEQTKDVGKAQVQIQEKIVEVERVVERRIPQVVEKLVHDKPQCDDLGGDVLRVYNDAIAGRDSSADGAAVGAQLVGGVPAP